MMRHRLMTVLGLLLPVCIVACEDSAERKARYAEKKPAPKPLVKQFSEPLQDLPDKSKSKDEAHYLMYKGEDMRQLTELSGRKVLIVFYSEQSRQAKDFLPEVMKYVSTPNVKAYAVFIDADEYPDLAHKYKLNAVPTTIMYLEGVSLPPMVGAVSATRLNEIIEQTLRNPSPTVTGR